MIELTGIQRCASNDVSLITNETTFDRQRSELTLLFSHLPSLILIIALQLLDKQLLLVNSSQSGSGGRGGGGGDRVGGGGGGRKGKVVFGGSSSKGGPEFGDWA